MQKPPNDITIFLVVTVFLIVLMGSFIITILVFYRKKQMAYFKDLEQIKSDYEKNLLKTHIEIQEQTFQTISRDIHDNINLSLTLAKLNLNTLDFCNKEKSSDQVNSSIGYISRAIIDLSDISRSLNSDIIGEQGLITALELEMEKLKKLDRFIVQSELSGSPVFMDAQKEVLIFRIIQESFNNILKHAHAKKIELKMNYEHDHVEIIVRDDGFGFDATARKEDTKEKPTSGLLNMRKRAELLNGSFCISSFPGAGTSIKILIPF